MTALSTAKALGIDTIQIVYMLIEEIHERRKMSN